MEPVKVFISYARSDLEIARKIYADLRKSGIDVWLDEMDLLPGQNWRYTIPRVIKESSYIIALLSSNSVQKRGYVQKELKVALDILDEFPDGDIFLIPVRIDNVEITDERLRDLHTVNLFQSYQDGIERIIRVLQPVSFENRPIFIENRPISERVHERVQELNNEYNLISKRLKELRESYIVETDAAVSYKLKSQIEEARSELKRIRNEIEYQEKRFDIFNENSVSTNKADDNIDQMITDLLSHAERNIASILDLSQLSDSKYFPLMETEDIDYYSSGFLLLKIREIGNIVKNYKEMTSEYLKNKELMKLIISLRDLKNNNKIQGDWYTEIVKRLSEKWIVWVEKQVMDVEQKSSFHEVINPFWYGNPIRPENSEIFVGRDDVIEKIQRSISQDAGITLFLYGRRRTGKSSTLLNLNRYLIKYNIICIYIDLQDLKFRESDYSFCYNVSKLIAEFFPEIEKELKSSDFSNNPFSSFSEFLDKCEILSKKDERKILLAFDEYERLEKKNKNILDTIRSIIQHRAEIITLIAGAHRFSEVNHISWSDYLINTKTFEISYLDDQSAYKLITDPVSDFDLKYSSDIPNIILEITKCQPYLLQAIGSELVDYLNLNKRKKAVLEDIEVVAEKVLIAGEAYFENIWAEELDNHKRSFMEEVVLNKDKPFDPKNSIARSLLKSGILEIQNSHLKISIPLFEFWIMKRQLMIDSKILT